MTEGAHLETRAALEVPDDAGPPPKGVVSRWLMELALAEDLDKDWTRDAQEAVDVYVGKGRGLDDTWRKRKTRFNILWSNVEVLRPSVYGKPPKPAVARRFRDEDPVGREAARVLQRALQYELDQYDFDAQAKGAVLDMLVAGRGVLWERYKPTFTEDQAGQQVIAYQRTDCELVQWKDFRQGPGRTWQEVTWVARRHFWNRQTCVDKCGDFGKSIPLDQSNSFLSRRSNEDKIGVEDTFKRLLVWEVWDKDKREVVFVAPSYKESTLPVRNADGQYVPTLPDPLGLENFFPCARPLVSVLTTDSQVPVTEFSLYADQARELDRLTTRITFMIEAMKARGIYDSRVAEIEKLMEEDDNAIVPAQNAAQIVEGGGLKNAIWMMPVENYHPALTALYAQREQTKQIIYEITGLSDIIRGSSKASETLGAQEFKVKFGSLRIQNRQLEVQRFLRDMLRIKAEIIAEHYTQQQLQMMTGIQVPDEVVQLLRNDQLRSFRIDIETDSTLLTDDQEDKKNVTEFMNAFGQLIAQLGPAIQSGYMPLEVARTMVMWSVRKFRASADIEDALESIGKTPPPPPPPDPKVEQAQAELQLAQQELQLKTQQQQADMQMAQQQAQIKMQESQAGLAAQQQQAQIQVQELQIKLQLAQEEAQIKQAELASRLELDREQVAGDRAKAEMQIALDREIAQMQEKTKLEIAQIQAQSAMETAILKQAMTPQASDKPGEAAKPEPQADAVTPVLRELIDQLRAPRRAVLERGSDGFATGATITTQ